MNKVKIDLEEILKLSQEELLDFNYMELIKRGYKNKNIIYTEDYVYAKGNIPVLLVAHCDIVHKQIPEIIVNDKEKGILWSPTGIGGDDRCGVYAILKICEKFKPYVLFTTDEEIGGVGVKKFVREINEIPVNFIIEIDRRGDRQAVFYQCGNKEFQNYILSFGFDKEYGSYSDVSTLSTHYDIAGCNLSAGYYREHTKEEHICMQHLENTINSIKEILKDNKNHKFYNCQEVYKTYSNYNWNNKNKDKDKNKKEDKDYEEIYDDYYGEYYDYYYDFDKKCYVRKNKEKEENEDFDEILQKEEDYYALDDKEWKDKYNNDKPKDIRDIY